MPFRAAAITGRPGLDPSLGQTEEFLLVLLAVVLAARFGGRGPGLLATALAALAAEFFIEPRYSFTIAHLRDAGDVALLVVAGAVVSFLAAQPREVVLAEAEAPRSWWDAAFLRRFALLGGAFVLLSTLTRLLYVDFEREEVQRNWVAHTYQVLDNVGALIAHLEHAETAQRAYLLTGDEDYLGPVQAALEGTRSSLLSLRRLTADNPRQKPRVDELERLAGERSSVIQENIALRRSSGLPAVADRIRRGQGERIMNEFRKPCVPWKKTSAGFWKPAPPRRKLSP